VNTPVIFELAIFHLKFFTKTFSFFKAVTHVQRLGSLIQTPDRLVIAVGNLNMKVGLVREGRHSAQSYERDVYISI